MAKMWEEKDHWLHHEGPWFLLKEVWDGYRVSEVSWFCDPECGWLLPTRCHFCSPILSAEEIESSSFDGHSYTVICSECGSENCRHGRNGSKEDNVMLFDHLAKRHNILVEEQLGLDQCVVTAHNLEHTVEDILRFSSSDNYWCEVNERVKCANLVLCLCEFSLKNHVKIRGKNRCVSSDNSL